MPTHYKFGGSTAARTLACPAWHTLSLDLPKAKASHAAALGTALHEIIEKCLLDVDLDPSSFVGQTIEDIEITQEHIDNKITPALMVFEDLMDAYDVEQYWAEVTAQTDEDVGGTADFVGLSADGKTLVVADYKSGDGIMVYAEENKQALFYAMCLFLDLKKRFVDMFKHVETIAVVIVQPSDRREDPCDIWETDRERLNGFIEDHDDALELVDREHRDPCPGDHCKFCPAMSLCPAKKELVTQARSLPIATLQLTHLSEALSIADDLEQWVKEVRKMAHEQLEAGQEVDGYKLVEKRASRVWNDTEETAKKIAKLRKIKKADAYDVKLRSPAQLEKLCKQSGVDYEKEFGQLVSAISTGTTLAKASDKRAAVIMTDAHKQIAARFAQ